MQEGSVSHFFVGRLSLSLSPPLVNSHTTFLTVLEKIFREHEGLQYYEDYLKILLFFF